MSRRHGAEEPSWFGQNWGWCLPLGGCLGCLGLIALLAALSTGGLFWLTENLGLDDRAMEVASQHPLVIDALGEPIEMGWTRNISMSSRDDSIEAEMTFAIQGPKGGGTIRTEGIKNGEEWTLNSLEFRRDGSDVWIDLQIALPGPQVSAGSSFGRHKFASSPLVSR